VLGTGIATGRNSAFYDRIKVCELVGIDPALEMHALPRRRRLRLGLPVELLQLSAEQLPAASSSFNTVTCTYSLCSITDPYEA
jgi:ubiquinone/menaquinone biosynthesis C-methylase UbiE